MKLFECVVGAEYRFIPSNPTVRLRIDENLGHNSIKTTCMDCGKVDTYAKSELESGKVYLCKHCGKNATYKNQYVDFKILRIFEHEKYGMVVEFSCNKCKKHTLHRLESVMAGNVTRCKHCESSESPIRKGVTFGRFEVTQIGTLKSGAKGAELTCKKCGMKVVKHVEDLTKLYKDGKEIESLIKCKCNQGIDIEKLRENTNFKTIEKSKNNNIEDCYAVCKDCGYKSIYKRSYILDGGTCKACKNSVKIGARVIVKKDVDRNLKYALSDRGRQHLKDINNTFILAVSEKFKYEKIRNDRGQYKLNLRCKCNNCNVVSDYELDSLGDIPLDIKKCQVCDFDIPLGSLIGSSRDKMEVIGFEFDNNRRTYVKLRCVTCGVEKKIRKSDVKNFEGCDLCIAQRKYNISSDSKIVGNIHKITRSSKLDSKFKQIGQYILYNEVSNKGITSTKARCCQCGFNDDGDFDSKELLVSHYLNTPCKKCDYLMKETKNYINNNNWVGYIKNSHIIKDIIDNGDYKAARIECLLCHKETTVPLTVFISSERFVCDSCLDTEVILRCPVCKGIHSDNITLRQLYSQDETYITCPVKNEKVPVSKFRLAHETQSKLDYFFDNYDLGEVDEVPGNSDLIKSKDKFYIGTDGEKYYTCYCKKHNKLITLREDEMMTYDHSFCADTRMFGYL